MREETGLSVRTMDSELKIDKRDIIERGVSSLLDTHKVPLREHLKVVQALKKQIDSHNTDVARHGQLQKLSVAQAQRHEEDRALFRAQLESYANEVERLHALPHIKGERGDPGPAGKNGKHADLEIIVSRIMALMPTPSNGRPGRDATFNTEKLFDDFIQRIRKGKLIDISQVNNAQGFMFNGKKYKNEELMHGGGPIISGRGSLQSYDISSQFDGVTTTFTVPGYLSVVQFIITGWPPNGVLRPIVDFTTPTSTTVALVPGQVTAPVSGTSGIILYVAA